MSLSLQKQKLALNELILAEGDKKQFMNPISKTTFEALPKIYGKKKKKKYLMKYQFQYQKDHKLESPQKYSKLNPIHRSQTNFQEVPSSHRASVKLVTCNMGDKDSTIKRNKTEMQSMDKLSTEKLSKPKEQFCNKKYCICNKIHQERLKQTRRELSKDKRVVTRRLPELDHSITFPDDVESRHKVIRISDKQQQKSQRAPVSLLDLLKSTHRNDNFQNQRYNQDVQSVSIQTNTDQLQDGYFSKGKKNNLGFSHRGQASARERELEKQSAADRLNSKQSSDQQQKKQKSMSVQIARPHSNINKEEKIDQNDYDQLKHQFIKAKSKRFASDISNSDSDDSRSVSSISSASLSKYVFDSGKKQNTMFHSLNKTQNGLQNSKSKQIQAKYAFQKKNGLFVIPEEEEYVKYLKDYEPMGEKFKIQKLVKKPNFKVIKEQQGVYFGQMQNNQKQGSGLMVSQKIIFQGKYKNNLKTYGCERNIDGVYKGQFQNGFRQGYGTFQWNNGEVFEGLWKNGTKNGYGTWRSPKGDFYEGEWKMNRQHGKGLFKHKLSTYRGQFQDFLKHGSGQQIFSNGDRYIGEYKSGKPHGKGKYQWADGGFYEGDFINGLREGRGRWIYTNDTIYEGEFKNDFKHGYGKQTYKSGQYYEGTFNQGTKCQGILYDLNRNAIKITSS